MCGIVGVLGPPGSTLESAAATMAATLRHRGPDDCGIWGNSNGGVAFGHTRLSIIDLSPNGHQPMVSASGRFVVTFNGEIYNYLELRDELASLGFNPRTDSDTEVLLAAFDQWGVESAVKRLNGMFAFGVYDLHTRRTILCRDRLGEKPLYYGRLEGCLVFASELKAIRAHPRFKREIHRPALREFLANSYIPAPLSIYEGILKLPPGTMLLLSAWDDTDARPRAYWSLAQTINSALSGRSLLSEQEYIDALDLLLRDVVRIRMHSDVPLGVFLSGGVDSSTVAALMQAQSTRPIKTFTIGFNEAGYDEASHARAVAAHLGCAHTELYATPQDALALVPRIGEVYDEPFADPSQIPTMMLSTLTRRHVTVSLSGDGGDELFGGYRRYLILRQLWDRVGRMPMSCRRAAAMVLTAPPSWAWDFASKIHGCMAEPGGGRDSLEQRFARVAGLIALPGPDAMYRRMMTTWHSPQDVMIGDTGHVQALSPSSLDDPTSRMMFWDATTYLPDDILVKVDRATMAAGLESRAPFLDHRLVEFAWSLPMPLKIRGLQGKLALKKVLDRYVPRPLIDRPKMGFDMPIGDWLRGPLRPWAESLLDESRLNAEGFLLAKPIRKKWHEHVSGRMNWQSQLWNILSFQSWLEKNAT